MLFNIIFEHNLYATTQRKASSAICTTDITVRTRLNKTKLFDSTMQKSRYNKREHQPQRMKIATNKSIRNEM